MAIEIVDLPIENCGSFHSYVSLPEGNHYFHSVESALTVRSVSYDLLSMDPTSLATRHVWVGA